METGGNGRLPDRVIASYRLYQSGHAEILSHTRLLEEKRVREWAHARVREWAHANDLPLAARDRLPSNLWLDFAEDYMAQHKQS